MAQSNGDETYTDIERAVMEFRDACLDARSELHRTHNAVVTTDKIIAAQEKFETYLRSYRKQHELEARQSEVESMGILAVDMPELLPLLAKRLDQIKEQREAL